MKKIQNNNSLCTHVISSEFDCAHRRWGERSRQVESKRDFSQSLEMTETLRGHFPHRMVRGEALHRMVRGSALIFTLLIVGMVSSLTFFVGRSAVKEVKIVNADQNSLGAYYTAEAGLEDGLARLAGDKDIEVPTCAFGKTHVPLLPPNPPSTVNDPCEDSDGASFNKELSILDLGLASPKSWPSRTRLAQYDPDGRSGEVINASNNKNNKNLDLTTKLDSNDFVYDLKITSRTKFFGKVDVVSGEPIDPTGVKEALIEKDYRDFTLYTSGNNVPDQLEFFWTCKDAPCDATKLLQLTIYCSNPLICGTGGVDLFKRADREAGRWNDTVSFDPSLGAVSKVRIKTIGGGAYLSVAFKNTSNPPASYVYFKGDKARLQSIGYHAGIKRRLEADIDRRDGSLLSLFDYAVYGGEGILQPN